MKTKTTAKQFELFKQECTRLLKLFSMDDWSVCFINPKNKGFHGNVGYDIQARNATIMLSSDWTGDPIGPTDQMILETARHEVIHLLLAPMGELLEKRYVTQEQVEEAEHRILTKLMNLLPR